MKAQHTPGPWEKIIEQRNKRCYQILATDGRQHPIIAETIGISGESSFNSDLIAAAPELLDALELARDMIIVSFENIVDREKQDHLTRIKAAIDKARGDE